MLTWYWYDSTLRECQTDNESHSQLKGKENTSHTFSWKLYLITVSNTVSIATNSIHVVHDDTYWNCNGWSLRIYMIPADAFLPQKYLHKYNYGYLMNSVTQASVWLREHDLLFLVIFNYGTNHLSLFFNLVLLMGIEWKQRLIQCQNKFYVFCLVICTVKCGWFSTKWVSIPTLRTLKCRHLFQVAQDWKTYFSMWNTWREN